MIKWTRTSRLPIKNSFSLTIHCCGELRCEGSSYRRPLCWASRLTILKPRYRIPTPDSMYRGTSLIRNSAPLGPYRRPMPRALGWSKGGGRFLMSEVTPHRIPTPDSMDRVRGWQTHMGRFVRLRVYQRESSKTHVNSKRHCRQERSFVPSHVRIRPTNASSGSEVNLAKHSFVSAVFRPLTRPEGLRQP